MLSSPTTKDEQEVQDVRSGRYAKTGDSTRSNTQIEQHLDYIVELIATDQAKSAVLGDQKKADTPPACSVATTLRFSVILTCRSQGVPLRHLLTTAKQELAKLPGIHELVLVDAVWHNAAVEVCRELGIQLVVSPRNRLGTMRAIGARNATGDVLTFSDVENVDALRSLPDHLSKLENGCDAVQSDRSYCSVAVPPENTKSVLPCRLVCDCVRSNFAKLSQLIMRVACGLHVRCCESPVQSIRRTCWDQLRLIEPGRAAPLELSLRCGWLNGDFVETCADKEVSCDQAVSVRKSLQRLSDALRISLVQRPDRMVVAPAIATFVAAFGVLAWAIAASRMLGATSSMVWIGAACLTMMVTALWVTAGWIATEYARQRQWLAPASKNKAWLGTISTRSSFVIGGALIVGGTLMMTLGAAIGSWSEAGFSLASTTSTTMSMVNWIWPGATLTLIGHQFSMAGMLVSWFRRQQLQ
jgi:hypothetical protein